MDIFHDDPMLQGIRQMMAAFAKSEIRPIAPLHDREESMPWDLMKKAANLGFSQTAMLDRKSGPLASADESGVAGVKISKTARLGCVAAEELAWGCAGIALALGSSGLACSPVARMGTEEQIKVFRDAMKGADDQGRVRVAAMALSEPSTGSDISGLATTAVKDGSEWIINGHKQWITNGQSASVFVVWAQTNPSAGRAGVRAFIVPRDTPGLVPGRKETKLGIRASETAQVHFEDCRVPHELMLGVAGDSKGLSDTKKMLDSTRPMVAAQAVGIARAAFEFTLERVTAGSVLDTPLAGHQHIAFALAEMETDIVASRLLVHRAAWMADHRQDNVKLASMAKARAAKTAERVTRQAMVILGEEALEPDHPVEKWYRDAKIYDIFEGTGQIQRRIIGKQLTGLNAT